MLFYLVPVPQHEIGCVIHFAAMKAVGESMEVPLLYYKNNVVGTINLLEVLLQFDWLTINWSSASYCLPIAIIWFR